VEKSNRRSQTASLASPPSLSMLTLHRLAEIIHNLLEISLSPSVPASLRNIPTKYNIIVRLWTYAFHKLLESLRRASFTSQLALEHLQDFIYYAYTFYTGLLEEPTLSGFKSGWLEALGDLARYRMAVAAMVGGGICLAASSGAKTLTIKAVNEAVIDQGRDSDNVGEKSISDKPAARIDDSPSPSVGIAAARLMDVEPETERWRGIARDWYGAGLAEQPGTGKLHHHLGLLCREVEGEELKGVYHFVKRYNCVSFLLCRYLISNYCSMTTLHPFPTSRESVLPIWSPAAQARRTQPDIARVPDLFVFLHGMLFTHIQLDDFQPTLARFIERLEIEGAEEREWIMMGIINIGAVFEYGRPGAVLRRVGGKETGSGVATEVAAMKVMMAKKVLSGGNVIGPGNEENMEVDEPRRSPILRPSLLSGGHQISPATSEGEAEDTQHEDDYDYPPSFKYALQLAFAMLSHVLRRPTRKASPFARSNLNPYLTVILTFLSTVLRHPPTLAMMERSIPWEELVGFFATVPRGIMSSQGLSGEVAKKETSDRWAMLTSGSAPPLPEDWCLRGMEWVGRKVFERGYWKSGEERRAESEVLEETEDGDVTDGRIEDDDDADDSGSGDVVKKRWVRLVRSGIGISSVVDGFTWVEGTREWKVEGRLAEKVRKWQELDRIEEGEEEKRKLGTRWTDDPMDIDERSDDSLSEDDEDEDDTDEVKALKVMFTFVEET
jgi:protein SMG6